MPTSAFRRGLFGLAALLPLACVTSTNNPPGAQSFDGGSDFDASVDIDSTMADSSSPDAAPPENEAGPDVDAGAVVTVTVLALDGSPRANAPVVFQDAHGAVLETKTTDAGGHASRALPDGGMLTVPAGNAQVHELFTYLGLRPGDHVIAIDVATAPVASSSLSVALPANPPAGTSQILPWVGDCEGADVGDPRAVDVGPGCSAAGVASALLLAYDEGRNVIGFSFKKNNSLATDGGTALVDGLPAWSTAFRSYRIGAVNLPTPALEYDVSSTQIAGGVPFHQDQAGIPSEGAVTFAFATFPGYGDAFQPQVAARQAGNIDGRSIVAKNVPPPADNDVVTFDFASALPAITHVDIDGTDKARPKILWTPTSPFTTADGGFARVSWIDRGDGGVGLGGWTFVFAGAATSVAAPSLPASLQSYVPGPSATVSSPVIAVLDEDDIVDYGQLLARIATLGPLRIAQSSVWYHAPILPAGATLRLSVAQNGL